MADNLGLGLTLDVSLLDKADKTLANMERNSQMIMQNISRGFTAFNEGKLNNFNDVINNIKEAIDNMNKTSLKLSPEFDYNGFNKGIDTINEVTAAIEKMQATGSKEFFSPNQLYKTTASMAEVSEKLNKLRDELNEVQKAVRLINTDPSELRSWLQKMNDIRAAKPDTFDQDPEMQHLAGKMQEYNQAVKDYGGIEGARLREEQLKEQIRIAQKELEWTQKTKAEQLATVQSYTKREIAEEKNRVNTVVSLYEENYRQMQKLHANIEQLEKERAAAVSAGDSTTNIDKNLASYRKELHDKLDIEREIVASNYPEIAKLKQKYEREEFIKGSKERVSLYSELQRQDVAYAGSVADKALNEGSVNEEREAVRVLEDAIDNLAKSTTNYKDIVADLNKKKKALEDHIKSVTRAGTEENTLTDSVINRYRKQLRTLDELNESLDALDKKQRETGIATAEDDVARQALEARKQTVADDIAEIEKNTQGQLDKISEEHEAKRAQRKVDAIIAANEREKTEYAALLNELDTIDKQKKSLEDAGGWRTQQYIDLEKNHQEVTDRITEIEKRHLNDLEDIKKKHDKKVLNESVNDYIEAENKKAEIVKRHQEELLKYRSKYGTISSSNIDNLIGVTDNAKNVNQHRQAIEALQKARMRLDSTDKKYLDTIQKLNRAIRAHEIEIDIAEEKTQGLSNSHRGLMDISGQLQRRLALVFSVSQVTQYMRSLVNIRGEFEKQEVALTTILKSKRQANELMSQVTELAVKSPFTLMELTRYTKQLAAYQIEYKKLFSTTKMLADVSAGLGVEMDRLILAFGQVRSVNYLRATETRQFTEAGLDILGELAKYYSELEGKMISVADVQERVTKRMVSFGDVEKVFSRMTSAGGIFFEMQEAQAKTLAGQWSNLQDKLSLMYNEVGKANDGVLKTMIGTLAYLADHWEGVAKALKVAAVAFAMVKINALLASRNVLLFARSVGAVEKGTKTLTVIQALNTGLRMLGRSLKNVVKGFGSFVASNPYVAGLLAIAAAGAEVWRQLKAVDERVEKVRKRYDELNASLDKINVAFHNAVRKQNIDEQKSALQELIDMANKDYQMNINVDVKGLSAEEIQGEINDIRQELMEKNAFASLFNEIWEGYGNKRRENKMNAYQEQASGLNSFLISDKDRIVSALEDNELVLAEHRDRIIDLLRPIEPNEQDYDYFKRLIEGYSLLLKEYVEISNLPKQESPNALIKYIAQIGDVTKRFTAAGIDIAALNKKLYEFSLTLGNASASYNEFLDDIANMPGFDLLSEEEKEVRIKFAIDSQEGIGELERMLQYELANKKFGIHITPIIDKEEPEELKEWQKLYKQQFEGFEGYTVPQAATTQEALIKGLKSNLDELRDKLERLKRAGEGAYDDEAVAEYEKKVKEVTQQLKWFGVSPDTKADSEGNKILNRRISLLKEIHEQYLKLKKDQGYSAKEAKDKVAADFSDTYRDAFGTDISGYVFTSKRGLSEALEGLVQIAQREGGEAALALSKEISKVDTEIEVEARLKNLDDLKREIDGLFSDYNLFKDLKKLNISKGIAEKLFGIEALDLDELREEFLDKIQLGEKTDRKDHKAIMADVALRFDDERIKEIEAFLTRIDNMEQEQQVERLKKYLAYTRDAIGERAKIKIEELTKLKEIEETFAKAREKAQTDAERNEINTQEKLAIEGVKKEANSKTLQHDWEEFRKSDTFINLFQDLETASDSLIKHAIEKIEEFKTAWADMPLTEAKEMMTKLNELELALMDTGRPFRDYRTVREDLNKAVKDRELGERWTPRNAHKLTEKIDEENIQYETEIEHAQTMISLLETINNKKIEGQAISLQELDLSELNEDGQKQISDAINDSVENNQKLIKSQQSIIANNTKNISNNNKLTAQQKAQRKNLQKQEQAVADAQQMANDLYDAFKNLANVFIDEDDPSAVFADMGMQMMNTVLSTIQLQLQLQAATIAAQALGVAMNTAMGIVGWIVMAVQLIVQALTAIFTYAEKKRAESIQYYLDQVKSLQNAFDELAESVDKALSFSELDNTINKLKILNKEIAKASINAIRAAQDGKQKGDDYLRYSDDKLINDLLNNPDKITEALLTNPDFLQSYKDKDRDKIIEALRSIKESNDEFNEALNDALSQMGGITLSDQLSVAEDFVDAWLESFKETGHGLDGLEDHFNEFFENLMKKQAAMIIAKKSMQGWVDAINDALDTEGDDGSKITEEEKERISAAAKEAKEMINDDLLKIFGDWDFGKEGLGLTGLQKGIQNITESTAQIIEAYLNSIRYFSEESLSVLYSIAQSISANTDSNPILSQLVTIAKQTKEIKESLNAVIISANQKGGRGIKVYME